MVNQKELFEALQAMGVDFFTGVPDSLLNDFCLYMTNNMTAEQHVMAANEGNAIAIAAGHYMATGKLPLVYMQNSGIGNATNPLLSLTHDCVYGIPMLLVIGWRGDPAISDHAQHKKQGELTPVLIIAVNAGTAPLTGARCRMAGKTEISTCQAGGLPSSMAAKKSRHLTIR